MPVTCHKYRISKRPQLNLEISLKHCRNPLEMFNSFTSPSTSTSARFSANSSFGWTENFVCKWICKRLVNRREFALLAFKSPKTTPLFGPLQTTRQTSGAMTTLSTTARWCPLITCGNSCPGSWTASTCPAGAQSSPVETTTLTSAGRSAPASSCRLVLPSVHHIKNTVGDRCTLNFGL